MKEHPAGNVIGVGRAAIWYGIEVEGNLAAQDIKTAFIDSQLSTDQLVQLFTKISAGYLEHIFLTENFDAWDQFESKVLPAIKGKHVHITIGTFPKRVDRLLKLSFINDCSIMVRAAMDATWLKKFRKQDQVSVGIPYDLATWCVDDAVRSYPADYLKDNL
jgi:hypothetical protein